MNPAAVSRSTARRPDGVAVGGAGLLLAGAVAWAWTIVPNRGVLPMAEGPRLALLLDLHDLRMAALIVVFTGAALVITGVPRLAARPGPPLLCTGIVLLLANLVWCLAWPGPGDLVLIVVTTLVAVVLAAEAAARRFPPGDAEVRTNRVVRLVPALLAAGAGFALIDPVLIDPVLPDPVLPDPVAAVRVLLVGAAVLGGLAVGRRRPAVRVPAACALAAAVLALGGTPVAIGLLGAGVLVLAWSGEHGRRCGVRAVGVLVAAVLPVVGADVLVRIGVLLGVPTAPVSAAVLGDGIPMIGAGLLLGIVLVTVDRLVDDDRGRPGPTASTVAVAVPPEPPLERGAGPVPRLTGAAGLLLVLAGLPVWAAAVALIPAATGAGLAADRAGVLFDASTGTGRWLLGELSDVRFAALAVVGVGLTLLVAGRPVPGGRAAPGLLGAAAVLFGANHLWGRLPGTPVALVLGSTALALAVVPAVMLRRGTGRAALGPGPALFVTGFVWVGALFGAGTSPALLPYVPPAHAELLAGARLLVVVAAVVAACLTGVRRFRVRAAAGAGTVALVGALVLTGDGGWFDDLRAPLTTAVLAVAVLVLVWSGAPARPADRVRQTVWAAVAGFLGSVGAPVLFVPGLFAMYGIAALSGADPGDLALTSAGVAVVFGLVLLGVFRLAGPRPVGARRIPGRQVRGTGTPRIEASSS